jgi:hypothetical protein
VKSLRKAFVILTIAALSAVAVPATATATSCSTVWGSLPKTAAGSTESTLATVRAGRHECFDRLVFDVKGPAPAAQAKYVDNVFRAGAGHLVPLRGGAKLEITLLVQEFNTDGSWAFQPPNSEELAKVIGYRTFRQVSDAGSTYGAAFIGLGVRARLPYRIFTLAGPGSGSRVVLDVAHHW